MISRCRGNSSANHASGHFSSASGSKVWLVVRERTLSETPCLVPTEVPVVKEMRHELRDRKRRVSVVELDRHLVGHPVPVRVPAPEAPSQIGQRTGDQKYSWTKRSP